MKTKFQTLSTGISIQCGGLIVFTFIDMLKLFANLKLLVMISNYHNFL